jgi:hypothetical protein
VFWKLTLTIESMGICKEICKENVKIAYSSDFMVLFTVCKLSISMVLF